MRAFTAAAMLSNTAPVSEAVAPAVGDQGLAARGNHVHARLASVTAGVTDANGEATVVFTRSFALPSGLTCTAIEDTDNGAIYDKVRQFLPVGGPYTSAIIKLYRNRPLPAVLTLLTSLINYRTDLGSASGVNFTAIAIQRSA